MADARNPKALHQPHQFITDATHPRSNEPFLTKSYTLKEEKYLSWLELEKKEESCIILLADSKGGVHPNELENYIMSEAYRSFHRLDTLDVYILYNCLLSLGSIDCSQLET